MAGMKEEGQYFTKKCTGASRQKQQGGQFYRQTVGPWLKIHTDLSGVKIKGEFSTRCQKLSDWIKKLDYSVMFLQTFM